MITSDHKQILKSASDYFEKLYSTKSNLSQLMWLVDSFFKKLNFPKLSEEQRTSCEGLVTKEECKKVIEMFENGKIPGACFSKVPKLFGSISGATISFISS